MPSSAVLNRADTRDLAGTRHDLLEHRLGEHPGRGVVAAAMIRVDEVPRLVEPVLAAVTEGKLAALEPAGHEEGVVPHPAERQHHPDALERGELGLQVHVAGADLVRQRLVAGGNALDRIDDARLPQLEPIVRRDRLRPRREPCLVKRAIEKLPRIVAGERPPGPVRPVQPGARPTMMMRGSAAPNEGTGRAQ